jgi:hypothetical protein
MLLGSDTTILPEDTIVCIIATTALRHRLAHRLHQLRHGWCVATPAGSFVYSYEMLMNRSSIRYCSHVSGHNIIKM